MIEYNNNSEYRLTAYTIKRLLESHHSKDYYATEVKTGASWGGNYLIFDAYVITKSWVNLKYIGYEIKVSRGDFLQDQKWMGYLPYCNEFYWVCPKDLIKKEEIDERCGLIYVYPSGTKRIVKRAKFRDIEPPVDILLYLIMWHIKPRPHPFFDNKLDFFNAWLERKEFSHKLGYEVSKSFAKKVGEINDIQEQNEELKDKLKNFEEIRAVCREFNIWGSYHSTLSVEDLRKRLQGTIPSDAKYIVNNISTQVERLKRIFDNEAKNL